MNERPIIFSGPMVRALLAGTKTQTRRVVKPSPVVDRAWTGGACWQRFAPSIKRPVGEVWSIRDMHKACPYGVPGDRLWVRETFCDDWSDIEGIYYRADGGLHADMFDAGCKWRPSIHMPRAASRITLEITRVRVERLQDISEADAMAEGAAPLLVPPDGGSTPHVEGYRVLWRALHGPSSWYANPWVWVIEFRRVP